jgi:hypothetical protein
MSILRVTVLLSLKLHNLPTLQFHMECETVKLSATRQAMYSTYNVTLRRVCATIVAVEKQ